MFIIIFGDCILARESLFWCHLTSHTAYMVFPSSLLSKGAILVVIIHNMPFFRK